MLIHADCFSYLDSLQVSSVDCIITDPPYNTTKCDWDKEFDFSKMWGLFWKVLKPKGVILIFGQEPFSSKLRLSQLQYYKYDYYWKKERPTNVMQIKKRAGKVIETISVFYQKQPYYSPQMTIHAGKKRTNKVGNGVVGKLSDTKEHRVKEYEDNGLRYPTQVLEFPRDFLKKKYHPTQKPVELIKYLVNTFTEEGNLVLDPFVGSGTTNIACRELNRRCIGIEKDKEFYNIALERLS